MTTLWMIHIFLSQNSFVMCITFLFLKKANLGASKQANKQRKEEEEVATPPIMACFSLMCFMDI
ncbi:hypothetical protein CLU79DRAFT_754824 [Phycomyces nitens]|nr:hypothetical protein CLU79DRAFT_754824 [Phycomyces nitens]